MPITQEKMLEQIEAARDHYEYGTQLYQAVLQYLQMLPSRYPQSKEVEEIINGLGYAVQSIPRIDDRVTYINEQYYKRFARINSKYRKRQELHRRQKGVPTREEALAMLHAKNELRAGGFAFPQTYEEFNRQGQPSFAPKVKKPRADKKEIIWPRDHPDDKELEFDTVEDLAPFANIPAPKDAENLSTGLDLQPIAEDDSGPTNEEPK